jgi:hypothetical protein
LKLPVYLPLSTSVEISAEVENGVVKEEEEDLENDSGF